MYKSYWKIVFGGENLAITQFLIEVKEITLKQMPCNITSLEPASQVSLLQMGKPNKNGKEMRLFEWVEQQEN